MILVVYSPGLRCRLAKPGRPLGERRSGAECASMASECERLVLAYLKVTDPTPFGTADPFGMVEGGQAALVKAICDVTSNVSEYPADLAPYASFLFGRLAARADMPKSGLTALSVFVEIDTQGC